jgi:hypothetical protein
MINSSVDTYLDSMASSLDVLAGSRVSSTVNRYVALDDRDKNFLTQVNFNSPIKTWFDGLDFSDRLCALSLPRPFSALMFSRQHNFNRQLFLGAPILFALLVDYAHDQQLTDTDLLSLVSLKRTDCLQALFDNQLLQVKSALKFLSAIDYKKLTFADLKFLKLCLQKKQHFLFSHHKTLTLPYLKMISQHDFLRSNKWLLQLDDARLMNQCVYQIDQILSQSNPSQASTFLKDLLTRVNCWQDILDARNMSGDLFIINQSFKISPPVNFSTLNQSIKLISNAYDLLMHGKLQNNCVFDYASSIISGSYLVFSVKVTKLCTLGVHVKADGSIDFDQLLSKNNAIADKTTFQSVMNWMNTYNAGINFNNGHVLSSKSLDAYSRQSSNQYAAYCQYSI